MSAIADIKACIDAHTSYGCYADVPATRPDEFVTVEITGGQTDTRGLREVGSYAVQCWSTSTYRADAMSEEVMDALNTYLTDQSDDIAKADCDSGYNWPTPEGVPRYQLNLEVIRKR